MAQTATDAVRYVYDQTQFSKIKSDAFENLTVEGTCGAEVFCKPGRDGVEICIKRYQWDRLGYDPHSREKNFSDSLYRYAVAWMDFEQAVDRYPGEASRDVLSRTISSESTLSSTYDDAPRIRWADARRKRVRIVKMEFLHQGEVWVCEFTRGGFLADPEPSLYVDPDGVPEWSIILQSAHVDRDGNRYGYVRAWLDIQDEINKRASKHLHLVSVRQTFSSRGAGGDVQKLKTELAKPDGHLQFDNGEFGKEFGVIPTMDMAQSQFQLLQEAKQEIDSVGVHAALAGQDGRDLSGRAVGKLQQGSSMELKPLFEAIAQFDNQVCRAVWNRIKQFWTSEKWIRVTGDEEAPTWIGLNMPVTRADVLAEQNGGVLPPELAAQPGLSEVVEIRNEVARIDVDFSIVEVPDVVNAMQEQFEAMTAIFPAIPEQMKGAAFEMLVESSSLRNKKKFLDKLKGPGDDPQSQAQAEQQAQTEEDMARAKINLTNAQAGKLAEDAEKSQAEKVVRMVEALYAAMQAGQIAMTVPGVAPVADAIALSAGYRDQNAAPIFPAAPAVTLPEETTLPANTDPRFPVQPQGPGVGMMHGIETLRNDGAR
jgi:hypothetical protein